MDSKKQIRSTVEKNFYFVRAQFGNKSIYVKGTITIKSDVIILILGKLEFNIYLRGKERDFILINNLPSQYNSQFLYTFHQPSKHRKQNIIEIHK